MTKSNHIIYEFFRRNWGTLVDSLVETYETPPGPQTLWLSDALGLRMSGHAPTAEHLAINESVQFDKNVNLFLMTPVITTYGP